MQKPLPLHLNTSPTSSEGSGTGKHEQNTTDLEKLETCPDKTARYNKGNT